MRGLLLVAFLLLAAPAVAQPVPTYGPGPVPSLPLTGGVVTGPTTIKTTTNNAFTVKETDGNTALTLANTAGTARLAVNIASTGAFTIFDGGGGGFHTALGCLNSVCTIPFLTGGALSNQALGGGGALTSFLSYSGALSGTKTGGSQQLALVQTPSDTVAAGAGGLIGQYVNLTSGGVGTTGNRIGQYVNMNFAGGTTNKGLGIGSQYGGVWSYVTASGNVGGTSGAGNDWGTVWGGVHSCTLASGATFYTACVGDEVDMGVSSGASAAYVQGIKVVLAHHDQAVQATDYMLGLGAIVGNGHQIANGISFGTPDGYWPIDSTGSLITTVATNGTLPSPLPYTARWGIDLSGVTFSSGFLKSTGFTVDGSGNVSEVNATVTGALGVTGNTTLSGLAGVGVTPVAKFAVKEAGNGVVNIGQLGANSQFAGISFSSATSAALASASYSLLGEGTNTYVNAPTSGFIQFSQANTKTGQITTTGAWSLGSGSPTLTANEVGLTKTTASGSAPGAGALKFAAVCGTNAGSAKIIAYAGTSTTPVTVVDNVGSGVTGC